MSGSVIHRTNIMAYSIILDHIHYPVRMAKNIRPDIKLDGLPALKLGRIVGQIFGQSLTDTYTASSNAF